MTRINGLIKGLALLLFSSLVLSVAVAATAQASRTAATTHGVGSAITEQQEAN